MTAKVILNPYAGRWLAQKRQAEAEAALQAGGLDYELSITNEPGHGLLLAEQAAREGFSPIISAGGDGSISGGANGVAKAAETNGELAEGAHLTPIGVLPLGTANDLVDNLGLPKDLQAAVAVIAAGNTRLMDLCIVNGRYFDNNSAIGLEPFITLIQQDMKRLKGTLRYLVATLRGVFAKPEWSMQLEWDNGEYRGPITLVTVGNSPRTGGLFYVTPHANPFDGKLTFVYGYMPTRMQILKLLPRTMKPGEGNYVEHPDIHEVHTTWLRVHSDQPTPAHADGEIISPAIHDLEYRVYPARLPILIP